MAAREVIELPQAYVEVEARPGYLFVVETGQLTRLSEVKRYTARLDAIAKRLDRNKALIDARGEIGDPPEDVREAMWTWLTTRERPIHHVAFVLATSSLVLGMVVAVHVGHSLVLAAHLHLHRHLVVRLFDLLEALRFFFI